jgi:hypothetical protein
MRPPHDVVRDAARIARGLADQANRVGEPEHADYFEQAAAEADKRADRLLRLWHVRWPRAGVSPASR